MIVKPRKVRQFFMKMVRGIAFSSIILLALSNCSNFQQTNSAQGLQILSQPWEINSEAELTVVVNPSFADETVSLTLFLPEKAQLPIDDTSNRNRFGIAGIQLTWLAPEQQETEIILAAASGARYIGLDFDWRRIEPEPGRFDWNELDRVVALAKEYNLYLVPMLLYTPQWASTVPFAPLDFHRAPPNNISDFGDFVYAVVSRFKPYGKSPLTSDGYGIRDWVIWNEPNTHAPGEDPNPNQFWIGSLEEYIELLRAGYEGAHAADPNSNVLNGAITDVFWTEDQSDIIASLERLYDPNQDGDSSDGARPFFDTLNIHLYQLDTPDSAWYRDRIEQVIAVMQRFGDEEKFFWITETGYGSIQTPILTNQPLESRFFSESIQAGAVRLVYETCLAYSEVGLVFWWSLRDYFMDNSIRNNAMEAHYGLLRANFAPKPAYFAYGQLTGSLEQHLTLTSMINDQGIAQFNIPSSFINRDGSYITMAELNEGTLVRLETYEVTSK